MAKVSDEELEKINFVKVYLTFKSYREQAQIALKKKKVYVEKLPVYQKMKLERYDHHLTQLLKHLEENDMFIQSVIESDVHRMFVNQSDLGDYLIEHADEIDPYSLDTLLVVFKQLVREWSADGKEERSVSFLPIIDEIENCFPYEEIDPGNVKILVPGAGLGRLPYELANRGFSCEGNEYSLFMLFISNFMLNRAGRDCDDFVIFPFLHNLDSVMLNKDVLRPVVVPDIVPDLSTPEQPRIEMSCGDFIEIYSKKLSEFHCVATCFFIDCPPNPVEVIEIIYQVLKPGGVWINNGPLRYHYGLENEEHSIQLSKEDLRHVIRLTGFEFEKETEIAASYNDNPRSMTRFHYLNWFFVCRRNM